MVDHEKLQPEEELYVDLVQELKDVYRFSPEEEQMLAQVQKRLAENTLSLPADETAKKAPSRSVLHLMPSARHAAQPTSTLKPRARFFNTLAAVLIMGLLISGLALTFNMIHQTKTGSPTTAIHFPLSTAPVKHGFWFYEGIRLDMFTEQDGWALGDSQQNPYSRILHTIDGAHSWQDVTPSAFISASSMSDGDIYVLDENTAWMPLCNPHLKPEQGQLTGLLRTTDGGKTWQAMSIITKDLDPQITFINQNEGWQLVKPVSISRPVPPAAYTALPSTPAAQSVLYHTLDGGKTWQKIGSVPAAFAMLNTMQFLNDQIGWAALNTPDLSQTALNTKGTAQSTLSTQNPTQSALYATLDGGKTWIAQTLPLPAGVKQAPEQVSLLNFINASTWYLLASFSSGQEYIYRTQDAGNSWQIIGNQLPDEPDVRTVLDSQHIISNALTYLAELTLINNRWEESKIVLPEAADNDLFDFNFFSPQNGFVLISPQDGKHDLYQTTNGGKTWIKLGSLPVAS